MSEKLIEFINSSVLVAAAIPVLTRALEQLELKLPLISCSRLSPILLYLKSELLPLAMRKLSALLVKVPRYLLRK